MYNIGNIVNVGCKLPDTKVKNDAKFIIGINAIIFSFFKNHQYASGNTYFKIDFNNIKDKPIIATIKAINLPRYPLPKNVNNQVLIM